MCSEASLFLSLLSLSSYFFSSEVFVPDLTFGFTEAVHWWMSEMTFMPSDCEENIAIATDENIRASLF